LLSSLRLLLTDFMSSIFTVLVFFMVSLTGCKNGESAQSPTVSFPAVHIGENEFIQEFKVWIKGGRVTALHRIPDDWDISLEWEDANSLVIHGQARHFSAGLPAADRLSGAIQVQSSSEPLIQAVIRTDRADTAGGGGRRKIPIRRMALSSTGTRSPNRDQKSGPIFGIAGMVTDSRSGAPIGDFLVTPRYAFTNTTPAEYGPWEEYEGERFQDGRFDLSYDQPLLVGAGSQHGWEFLIEAEGYEPFITRVVATDESGRFCNGCRGIPTPLSG
jgi:hypothetical protein